MILKKINKSTKKRSILVVPLDWGLGHATRCIPLIKELLLNDCDVIIAAEKTTKSLLQLEFQHLTFIPLKGYHIHYSKKGNGLALTLLSQIPQILLAIYREHQWLKKVVKKYTINAILADNRFGLYHSSLPSVYITHQLLIKTGSRLSEQIAQKIHYWFIRKYSQCWVPDFEGTQNIAGELSHPSKLPPRTHYIGCLSRFEKIEGVQKKYDLLIMISGPEPQRTIFEKLLLIQLEHFQGKALLVRGLPLGDKKSNLPAWTNAESSQVVIKNHLSATELNLVVQQADLVICRSGYTTIMDLAKLGQKAILVPTPGQTEQEYLATHLMKEQLFYAAAQEGFSLTAAIKNAAGFPLALTTPGMEQFKRTVYDFVQSLR
ncbi:MAG: glycosyl transferase family 28 [Ferruginibacter sp.]|nr:glycosyl transferase family 28 [Ferruginibacter sp.]